jgi:IS30 family transposase
MSQKNNTTIGKRFKHLTEKERYTIEVLLKEGRKPYEIAHRINKSTRTIEREIARGTVILLNSNLTERKEYCADAGQRVYEEFGRNKGPSLKIGKDHALVKHIEEKIVNEKYSPDAVIGEIRVKKLAFETKICTKTVYNYIDRGDVFLRLTNKDLPVKRDRKKGAYKHVKIAHKNLKGRSIEERSKAIEKREEYGHWEMDCVVGKQGGSSSALLVLSERKTREEMIFKIPDKTQESVIQIIDTLECKFKERFKEKFKTITVDNGSEFLNHERLEKSFINPAEKRVLIYYAHPYSSWERGTNENINKLIRRFIPKGTDIGIITKVKIKKIEKWLNNYPRKIFGYKSSNDMKRIA